MTMTIAIAAACAAGAALAWPRIARLARVRRIARLRRRIACGDLTAGEWIRRWYRMPVARGRG